MDDIKLKQLSVKSIIKTLSTSSSTSTTFYSTLEIVTLPHWLYNVHVQMLYIKIFLGRLTLKLK